MISELTESQKKILMSILDVAQGVHGVPDPGQLSEQVGKQIFYRLLQLEQQDIQDIIKIINNQK